MADKQARKEGQGQQREGREGQERNLQRDQSGRFGGSASREAREGQPSSTQRGSALPAQGINPEKRRGVDEDEEE